jgi:hypothetical protein
MLHDDGSPYHQAETQDAEHGCSPCRSGNELPVRLRLGCCAQRDERAEKDDRAQSDHDGPGVGLCRRARAQHVAERDQRFVHVQCCRRPPTRIERSPETQLIIAVWQRDIARRALAEKLLLLAVQDSGRPIAHHHTVVGHHPLDPRGQIA